MLFWANASTHADELSNYISTIDLQYATYHKKNEFTEWPMFKSDLYAMETFVMV